MGIRSVRTLASGLADFREAPVRSLDSGLFVIQSTAPLNISYLTYPAAAVSFVLIGPFAAISLYELSRRLQSGEQISWSTILRTIWVQKGRKLSWMAFVVHFIQIMWMYQVCLLLERFLGFK